MRHTTYRALIVTLAAAVACKGDRVDDQTVTTTTSEGRLASPSANAAEGRGTSMVRMINALPTGTSATVTADDRAMFSNIDYKAVTPYTEIRDNITRFRLQGSGRDTTIASNNEIMMDGSRYTMVTLPGEQGSVRLRVLNDKPATDSTRARLRVVHGLSGVGDIDLLFLGRTDPIFNNVSPS
jgi:hypothetical protein